MKDPMIQTKSLFGNGVTVVIMVVATVTALHIDAAMNANAQNMTTPPTAQQQNQTADPQQIKNYLTQAIQALDTGNNTMAAEQIELAEDQLEGTGTEVEDEDEEGEEEAGEVEDEDEPGEEETP
jgi:basic membrane lipoprotein Med (substrate-binding protein (PBP1-ABC) superfamily)